MTLYQSCPITELLYFCSVLKEQTTTTKNTILLQPRSHIFTQQLQHIINSTNHMKPHPLTHQSNTTHGKRGVEGAWEERVRGFQKSHGLLRGSLELIDGSLQGLLQAPHRQLTASLSGDSKQKGNNCRDTPSHPSTKVQRERTLYIYKPSLQSHPPWLHMHTLTSWPSNW